MIPYEWEPAFNEIIFFSKNRYKDNNITYKYRERGTSTIVLGKYGFQYPIEVPFDIFRTWSYDDFMRIVFQELEKAHKELDDILQGKEIST